MELTLHWSLPIQVCNSATWGTSHSLLCTQDHPCVVNDYNQQEVPHSWIIKSIELIGINNNVMSLTKKVMSYWRTHMRLHTENKLIETDDIKIQCGIFQGDSLSPLLFCICLIPLTEQLNRLNKGCKEHTTKTKISHLLYMIWSWLLNQRKSSKNRYKQLKPSVIISIWNLDLKNVPKLHLKTQTCSVAKFREI